MEGGAKSLDVSKVLQAASERVKMVDLHPKEPLVIASLYSGQVTLWNYENQTMVKAFEICDLPVRCVKFISRLQSFASGSDDMLIRIYNYNTMEKTTTFEAHQDYIRAIAVHDQLPYLLTSSDDMTIKLWDWSKQWTCQMTFEGHAHYVMSVVFNPKDHATFATASLDQSVMVWNVTSPVRNFALEGHEQGVNSVEYYHGGDKPYIISGSDDQTVKVWDYQTKACLQTLTFHVGNVSCVSFIPDQPLLISGSEDSTCCIISMQTWRQEASINYNFGRAWTISARPKLNRVAIGFDQGLVVLKVGKEEPVMSMDSNGKILIAQQNEIIRMDVKTAVEKDVPDGELIQLPTKDVGTCEGNPTKILHGPNGQYVAVVTEEEYTVNSALGWRPKTFGRAIAFVWGPDSGSYAILENSYTLKTFKAFKPAQTMKLDGQADQLYEGPLLGVRVDGSIFFFEWEGLRLVRQISETPKDVKWSDSGELVALMTETSAFILKYHPQQVTDFFASGKTIPDDGIEASFDIAEEVEERMKQCLWVGDCLVSVNKADRLGYYIGGETTTIAVLPRGYFLLGYVAKENRLYCIDKDRSMVAYQLFTSVIAYKTAIVREEFDAAREHLPKIPDNMKQKVAEFLQARNLLALAMEITPDDDHKFDLAIELRDLGTALDIAQTKPAAQKWKQVGDVALELAHFDVAAKALRLANDLNGLLLLYTSVGASEDVFMQLAKTAVEQGKTNVAFSIFQIFNQHSKCIDLLLSTNRIAEAAFYARTYCHQRVAEVVAKWKVQLAGIPRLREALADPEKYPNLFPNINLSEKKAEEEEEAVAVEEPHHQEQPAPAAAPVPAQEEEEEVVAPTTSSSSPPRNSSSADRSSPTGRQQLGASGDQATPARPFDEFEDEEFPGPPNTAVKSRHADPTISANSPTARGATGTGSGGGSPHSNSKAPVDDLDDLFDADE